MTVFAGVVMNSGEAFVSAISQQTGREFGIIKIFLTVHLFCFLPDYPLCFREDCRRERGNNYSCAFVRLYYPLFNRLFGSAVENWLTGSKEEKKMRTDAK